MYTYTYICGYLYIRVCILVDKYLYIQCGSWASNSALVYIYICIHIHICIEKHSCIHVHFMPLCVNVYTYMYTYVYIQCDSRPSSPHMYFLTNIHMCIYIRVSVCECIHFYIHICIYRAAQGQ